MKLLLTHRGYDVFIRPQGNMLCAQIMRPPRNVAIADIPAVPSVKGEAALKPLAKAAIERDLRGV